MSTVAEVERAVLGFAPQQLDELRDWLENLLEDRLEITDEFKAQIEQGKTDIVAGRVLRKLPAAQKIEIIEVLWSDLAEQPDEVESPTWHEKVLHQTEADFVAGKLDILDWEEAKRKLRSEVQ